jgi:uncharacterized membrane protein YsdA (DUF1294 family)
MFEPELSLSWQQRFAAFWAISWPAWIVSFATVSFDLSFDSTNPPSHHLWIASIIAQIAFFATQALLVHRLPRKKFRTFRLEVVRDGGESSRTLSAKEGVEVWFWIIWPQVMVVTVLSLLAFWMDSKGATEVSRGIPGLAMWTRILIVGPYAIDLAMRTKYSGFRMRIYGYRFI